ncbi:hypothetical protein Hamer_G031620 [Homarus americanus]|uniref:Uncharacterized protein n=1 Tax=Homarus americanus TaxID=6706 RepID=A0A8J5MPN1_HOMAM|nr:hypothetical protein Hamer_G031620 [Homarus americanus]
MSFSRSTIRRYRASGRKQAAETDRKSFSPDEPLLLHWDGKLLPDVQNTTASRIAIVVTFNGQEKLLGVPKKREKLEKHRPKHVWKQLNHGMLRNWLKDLYLILLLPIQDYIVEHVSALKMNWNRNLFG